MEASVETWPASPEHVRSARRAASEVATRAGAREAALDAIRLAVSEAVSNVIVHGYRNGAKGVFTVEIETPDATHLQVTVRDDGCGMRPRADSPGAGLGLPLIASLASSVSVTTPPEGGTEVVMTFALTE